MSQAKADVAVVNIRGLHARAAAKFCEMAAEYKSTITVSRDGMTVGGTSLMALLMLGAGMGSTIRIEAQGEDADMAVKALSALVTDKFGEKA